MRNEWVGLVRFIALGVIVAANGCTADYGGGATGGAPGGGANGNGGSPSIGGGPGSGGTQSNTIECANVAACGGDVVGTWNVSSTCLNVTGRLNVSLIGMTCSPPPVSGSLQVTGTWIADSNASYTDNTTTTGYEKFTLDASCLIISSTPTTCSGAANVLTALGFASVTCTPMASGGCDCSTTINQVGGIGLVSPLASASGSYDTSGNVLTADATLKYSFCASGNTLTLTPQSTSMTTTGTIILQKAATSGSGGAPGSGGQPATGGAPASGGETNLGGNVGVGGNVGAGGAPITGGNVGAGGVPVTGGTRAVGGASVTGGTRAVGGASDTGGTHSSGGASAAGGTLNSGGSPSVGGGTGSGGVGTSGPCDIYAASNTPCVAAHSTVRALYGSYSGKLYQVRRTDNTTKDILTLAPGGIADTAPQDTFCTGSTCVLTVVYDQSGKGNDLWYQGSTQVPASTSSSPARATTESLNVSGHKVYSVYINPGNCYWHDGSKSGMPTGAQPEAMYMVTSGKHSNAGCCFDYGNSETDRSADGSGAMDSLNFSTTSAWGTGAGNGPWIMADLEYGLFAQGSSAKNTNDPTQTATYVTAVLRNNGTTEFALRGGDATTGSLSTYYKGALPGGWSPMKKQGALILGCGGDCCKPSGGANASAGTFYEGAIVTGYPTDATENAVQANIVAAGYGK